MNNAQYNYVLDNLNRQFFKKDVIGNSIFFNGEYLWV